MSNRITIEGCIVGSLLAAFVWLVGASIFMAVAPGYPPQPDTYRFRTVHWAINPDNLLEQLSDCGRFRARLNPETQKWEAWRCDMLLKECDTPDQAKQACTDEIRRFILFDMEPVDPGT